MFQKVVDYLQLYFPLFTRVYVLKNKVFCLEPLIWYLIILPSHDAV